MINMPHTITLGQWLMAAIYTLLVGVWFTVLIKTDDILRLRQPTFPSHNYLKIKRFFKVVAFSMLVDSIYWAVTNIAEMLLNQKPAETGIFLRNPYYIAIIKTFVLASAIAFYYSVERSIDALNKEFQEAYFSKLVNFTWDAIGILDREGRMKIWNEGAEKLFKWKQNEVLDRHIRDFLVPEELRGEIDEVLADIRTTHKARQHYNTIRRTAYGERVPVDISISPIMDPDFKGFFGIMRKAMPSPFVDFRYFTPNDVPRHSEGYVFVAMPFTPNVVPQDVWSSAIRNAIETNSLIAVRADYETLTGVVMNQIFNDIRHATLVVADLTGKSPNVFYEIGLAHTLGKPVIQLQGDQEQIPFDIAHIRTIQYSFDNLPELRDNLANIIKDHLTVSQR
jgi:PAS domain S-box-containing protein